MAEIEVEETEDTGPLSRSQMPKHQHFVDWYEAEYGEDLNELDATNIIARFAGRRAAWRKSDGYLETFGKDAREAAKAERLAAREAEKAAKAEERAAAKAEKDAAKAAAAEAEESTEEAPKPAAKRTTKKAAPAKRAGKKAAPKASAASEDEAFE